MRSAQNRKEAAALPQAAVNGGGGAPNGGGGGGGGPGGVPLQRRTGDREFRDVLGKGLSRARRKLIIVALFSFWVNLLVLGIPIYLFNISDRVLTSRSVDTLIMLTLVIAGAIFGHVVLDIVRRFILMRIAVEVECRLGRARARGRRESVAGRFEPGLPDPGGPAADPQFHHRSRAADHVRCAGRPRLPPRGLPIHPDLGWIVTITGGMLLVFALINQRLTAVPFAQASAYATRANLQADAMARNAQVINAMGMIPEAVVIWGRETAESLKAQVTAQDRNIVIAGMSKGTRLLTQIAMLGWGASLALDGKLTGGMMIAASIIGGRALPRSRASSTAGAAS